MLTRCGLDADLDRPAAKRQAAADHSQSRREYGAAKCWLPEYFAKLADRLIEELGATVLISAAPKERAIVDAIKRHMKHAPSIWRARA